MIFNVFPLARGEITDVRSFRRVSRATSPIAPVHGVTRGMSGNLVPRVRCTVVSVDRRGVRSL